MIEWAAAYDKDALTVYNDGRKFLGVVRRNQQRDHRGSFRIAGRVPLQTLADGDHQDVFKKGRLTLMVTSRIAAECKHRRAFQRPRGWLATTALITGTDTARMPNGSSQEPRVSAFSAATLWSEIHSLFWIG